jgi:hypothetical protein
MDAFEDYLPLWLELHVDEQSWLFELRAGEERAVVVGSHPSADVRVAREGIASTHFHFEREAGGVVIVPGYRAALVVDRVPAPEPVTVTKGARVEFCGALLEATVHDVPPLEMLPQARDRTDRMMRRPGYFKRLPGDTEPTVVAVAAAVSPSAAAAEEPGSDDEIDTMTTTAWRAVPPPSAPVGPQGTLIIQRSQSNSEAGQTTPVPAKTPSLPPIAPAARIRFDPWTPHDVASSQSSPTRVEVPHPRGSVPPPVSFAGPGIPSTADESARSHSLAPTEHAVATAVKRASALAQLGLAATRHPIRVALVSLPVCVVLALAFVGAARLAGKYPAATASKMAGTPRDHAQSTSSTLATAIGHESASVPGVSVVGSTAPAPSPSFASASAPSAGSTVVPARQTSQRAPRRQRHVFLNK